MLCKGNSSRLNAIDFVGSGVDNSSDSFSQFRFRVAFGPVPAPALTGATPDDGATALPLNTQIQLQFDQPMASPAPEGITLYENDSPVDATVRVESDGKTISVIPSRLPLAPVVLASAFSFTPSASWPT